MGIFYRGQDSSGISIWSTSAAEASHFLPVHLTPVLVNLPSAGGSGGQHLKDNHAFVGALVLIVKERAVGHRGQKYEGKMRYY